ncbi:MAG: hypothetical protein ACREOS_13330 [Candidatus Dormibacteraceae bacterium]
MSVAAASAAGKDGTTMTTDAEVRQDPPIECRLLEPERRARAEMLQQEVLSAVEETHELPDGIALRFHGEPIWLATLAEFIGFERACCPFLRFELHAEQQNGPLWLRLRGPTGTKEFLATLMSPPVKAPAR